MATVLPLPVITKFLSFLDPRSKPHSRRIPTFTRSSATDQSLSAKQRLVDLIANQDRGLKTQNDPSKPLRIIEAIEAMAEMGRGTVTAGPSLSGTWRLMWTTEKEQLFIIRNAFFFGTRAGDVLQVIDFEKEKLNNVITFPPHGVFFVRSGIEIVSPHRVNFRYYLCDERKSY